MKWSAEKASCPMCRTDFLPATATEDNNALALTADTNHINTEQLDRELAYRDARAQARTERQVLREMRLLEHNEHCNTCTDSECQETHARLHYSIVRHLSGVSPRLSSLPHAFIVLLSGFRAETRSLRNRLLDAVWSSPDQRRIAGLMKANLKQEQNKYLLSCQRKWNKPTRHSNDTIRDLDQKPLTEGTKVFKGYTPPKRHFRLGDIHEQKDGCRGVCIGHNLWRYSNGEYKRLDGKGKWLTWVEPL
jgi:hypothetical protein